MEYTFVRKYYSWVVLAVELNIARFITLTEILFVVYVGHIEG